MALIKTQEEREISLLKKVEQDLVRRERRERIHHVLIAGLAILSITAFVGGPVFGRKCKSKRHFLG